MSAVGALLLSRLSADSWAAEAVLGCPGTAPAGGQFTTEVTIDVGGTPLGAYWLTLTYDPMVLAVVRVSGGEKPPFFGAPGGGGTGEGRGPPRGGRPTPPPVPPPPPPR